MVYSSQSFDHPTSLPDPLLALVRGLGHLGGDEHQVDIVSSRDCRLERGGVNDNLHTCTRKHTLFVGMQCISWSGPWDEGVGRSSSNCKMLIEYP